MNDNTNNVKWKLQLCKQELQQMNIKKSGENKFNHYKYYELEDILPPITNILINNKLASVTYQKDSKMYLEITDVENNEIIRFDTKIKEYPQDNNKNKDYGAYMKIQQGLQTYARRALWLLALDIVEPNDIEATPTAAKQEHKKQVKKPSKTKPQNTIPKKSNQDPPVTEEKIKEVLDAAYEKVTNADMAFTLENADFTIKRLCNNQKLYNACIRTLESKPANLLDME